MRGIVLQFIVENEQRKKKERKNYLKPGIRIMALKKKKKDMRIFNRCNKMAMIIKKNSPLISKSRYQWCLSKMERKNAKNALEKRADKKVRTT